MSTTRSFPARFSGFGRMVRIAIVAIVALATLGIGATAGASALASSDSCAVTWGSLPKASAPTATGSITGVRTGRHSCFDRFVVDLDGDRPGYRVEYVDAVYGEGSGELVPVDGGAVLSVVVMAPAYDDNGSATVDPAKINATNVSRYQTFRDIEWADSFEGQTTLGLGVRARLPFRVFTLDGPGDGSRLVIDVAHRWTQDSSTPPADDLPGTPFDSFAKAGDELAVIGVAHDDVLNIRKAPGTNQRIVARAEPDATDLVATGRARALTRSIWYEVRVDGVTGWASLRYLGFIGDTDDVTAAFLAGGPLPTASSLTRLGELVADGFASDDPPSRIVLTVAPSVGDLGEVTYDVIGLGDDAAVGLRLHIFAVADDGGGFTLKSIEATTLCGRGVADNRACI